MKYMNELHKDTPHVQFSNSEHSMFNQLQLCKSARVGITYNSDRNIVHDAVNTQHTAFVYNMYTIENKHRQVMNTELNRTYAR